MKIHNVTRWSKGKIVSSRYYTSKKKCIDAICEIALNEKKWMHESETTGYQNGQIYAGKLLNKQDITKKIKEKSYVKFKVFEPKGKYAGNIEYEENSIL